MADMQGSKRAPVPPPLRLDGSLSSGELARLVAESIEDVAQPEDDEAPLPFSPSVVAKQ